MGYSDVRCHTSTANPCKSSSCDEFCHVSCKTTKQAAKCEDCVRENEACSSAKDVAELDDAQHNVALIPESYTPCRIVVYHMMR